MEKKFYAVTVKLGHVGRNNYIIKTIPVIAENGKEAAEKARWTGRVKHHHKDAIQEVRMVDIDEYQRIKEQRDNDPFFNCSSVQEQRATCIGIENEIHREETLDDDEKYEKRKQSITHKKKRNKIIKYEHMNMIRDYQCYIYA